MGTSEINWEAKCKDLEAKLKQCEKQYTLWKKRLEDFESVMDALLELWRKSHPYHEEWPSPTGLMRWMLPIMSEYFYGK